jgi:predicted chitinase
MGSEFPKDHERVTGHRKCKSRDPLVTTVTTAVAALLVATLLLVATAVATVAAAVTATATAEAAEATTATAAGATLSSLVNTDATTVEPGRELSVKGLSQRWIGRSIEQSIERSSQALFRARQDRIGNWKGSNTTEGSGQQPSSQDQERGKGKLQLTPGRSWRS